jgi:TetR/AcrR family transcriptional regulator, transcriptional repressor for nem operon
VPVAGQLTPKGRRTRERIIDAAAELVFSQGLAATTLDEVKAAAGVGASQLYHYFDSKADLLSAIIEHHTETIVARQEPELRAIESVQALRAWCAFVVGIQRSFDCHGGCPIGSLGSELAEHDEAARTAISASLARWEAALRDGLARLRERGLLTPDANPDTLALHLIVTLQGGLLLGKIHRSDRPLRIALTSAIDHVETYVLSPPRPRQATIAQPPISKTGT